MEEHTHWERRESSQECHKATQTEDEKAEERYRERRKGHQQCMEPEQA